MDVVVVVESGSTLTSEGALSSVTRRYISRNAVVGLAAETVALPRLTATLTFSLKPRPLRACLVYYRTVPSIKSRRLN